MTDPRNIQSEGAVYGYQRVVIDYEIRCRGEVDELIVGHRKTDGAIASRVYVDWCVDRIRKRSIVGSRATKEYAET